MGKLIRALGVLIALASVALGIYLQTADTEPGSATGHYIRAVWAFEALPSIALGLLLAAFGHFLMLREDSAN